MSHVLEVKVYDGVCIHIVSSYSSRMECLGISGESSRVFQDFVTHPHMSAGMQACTCHASWSPAQPLAEQCAALVPQQVVRPTPLRRMLKAGAMF